MGLLMIDLDNTLVDRAGAYRRWAEAFIAERTGDSGDVDWLIDVDGDGFAAREQVAARIIERFDLGSADSARVVEDLRRGMIEHIDLVPDALESLATARNAGWRIVCVTNGAVQQQQRKIDATGLTDYLDGAVISEGAGVRKPDPRIFHRAAEIARLPLDGSWMIGDSADADIAGGAGVGASTAWLRRGRDWDAPRLVPSFVAETLAAAIHHIGSAPGLSEVTADPR